MGRGPGFDDIMLVDDVVRLTTTPEERGETYEAAMEPARAAHALLGALVALALLAALVLVWLFVHLVPGGHPMHPPSPPVVVFALVFIIAAAFSLWRFRVWSRKTVTRVQLAAADARPDDYTRKLMEVRAGLDDPSCDLGASSGAAVPAGASPRPLVPPEPPVRYWN